jgi:aspartate aminotransferase
VVVISRRLSSVKPSGVRELFNLARKYPGVVDLTLGEPDVTTPLHIREAARRALDEGYTHYTPNAGLSELRQAIADRYERDYGARVDVNEILITQVRS